ELKGFAYSSLWTLKDQRVIARLLHGSLHNHAVNVVQMAGVSRGGRTGVFEMLVLPLEGGIDNPRALGSLIALEKPYWLGADPIIECRIEALRVIDPDVEPVFLKNRPEM